MEPRAEATGNHRLIHLAWLLFSWSLLLVARLVYLQVWHHADYTKQAKEQQEKSIEIPAPRGSIFDRSHHALALSVVSQSACVNPQRLKNLPFAAELLAGALKMDQQALLHEMQVAYNRNRGFLWVKRRLSEEEAESIRGLKLEGVELRPESWRSYPNGSLAAHVVGSVDSEQKGNAGIEQYLDDELQGQPGLMAVSTDVRQIGWQTEVLQRALPGKDLHLTIDQRIQFVAEQKLREAIAANKCKTGTLVAMDPNTGEILAMASYPSFDPTEPLLPGQDIAPRTNLVVSTPFEPGSVFKVITLASALETTNLKPSSIISCGNGAFNFWGHTVHDTHSYGALSMQDVLAHSSNIGAINVGIRVGEKNLLDYILKFGFGRRTGIPLPGESPGRVRRLKEWSKTSISAVPMGQEVSVTALQLAQACSVVANGGLLVKPKLVTRKERFGEALPEKTPDAVRVITRQNAITMRRMMQAVVEEGTGKATKIKGYSTGGKTGTAQIYDQAHHQYLHGHNAYNASFMGFAPLQNPQIVVVVTLSPASGMAASVAGPVFKDVMTECLRMKDIRPDRVNELVIPLQPEAQPTEVEQQPEPATPRAIASNGHNPATAAASEEAPGATNPAPEAVSGPRVPNFQGQSLRSVLQQSAALGVPVVYTGSGIAKQQSPAAGAVLPPGEKVRIQFAR